jgi:hypothetical protein
MVDSVRRRIPPAPKDVRVQYRDGSTQPVEVAYIGRSGGTHHWEVTTPVNVRDVEALLIGVFPARSAITFGMVET